MDKTTNWKGMTLEELRMKRAKALILSEVTKAQLLSSYNVMKAKTNSHGVRALLFHNSVIKSLKTADYLFLGAKAAMFGFKLWKSHKK